MAVRYEEDEVDDPRGTSPLLTRTAPGRISVAAAAASCITNGRRPLLGEAAQLAGFRRLAATEEGENLSILF